VSVPDDAVQRMQAHLKGFTDAYPRANFGPVNQTTARDMLAAAILAAPKATPDDVAVFLKSKFRDKRPYPYESGPRRSEECSRSCTKSSAYGSAFTKRPRHLWQQTS
jgi:hypothetical protein